MSDTPPLRAGKIRNVFAKAANKEIIPYNFGNYLLTAVKEGFCTIDELAEIMEVEPDRIRKIGNSMKAREISHVASELINRRQIPQ